MYLRLTVSDVIAVERLHTPEFLLRISYVTPSSLITLTYFNDFSSDVSVAIAVKNDAQKHISPFTSSLL